MSFYWFPFCQTFSSHLSWCQHRIGLLVKMWYFFVSIPFGLNQLFGIQTKLKCSNKIGKVENGRSYFCSEMSVSCWYLLQTIKRNPKLQKLDRDCKLKLSLSLLLQLDQFFDQSRIDQLIKAVSEDKAHASGSNSAKFCCYN